MSSSAFVTALFLRFRLFSERVLLETVGRTAALYVQQEVPQEVFPGQTHHGLHSQDLRSQTGHVTQTIADWINDTLSKTGYMTHYHTLDK